MIRVELRPEPPDFDVKVRQPGLRDLAKAGDGAGGDGAGEVSAGEASAALPPHWRKCLPDLLAAYQRICAYLSLYIHPGTGAHTADHFVAKSRDPHLAYEWSNYRLACSLMNSRKGAAQEVLDPFEIENGWFQLNLVTLKVRAAPQLDPVLKSRVEKTIKLLRLNDRDCTNARKEYLDDYGNREVSLDFIRRRAPFLGQEVERQGFYP